MRAWIYNKALMGLTPHWYENVLKQLPENARLLDVGIGTGEALLRNAALIREKNLTIHGVDIDGTYLKHCEAHIKKHELTKQVSCAHQSVYDHTEGPYDGVYFGASFMLLPDPTKALHHVASLLKPDGLLYFTQTFHDKPSPMMEKIKPLLHKVTTIHFGRVTYEHDFRDVIQDAGMNLQSLNIMSTRGRTSYRSAVVNPN